MTSQPESKFALVLTEAEGKQLLVFIDTAVKSLGLQSVDAASAINRKIQESYQASRQAGMIASPVNQQQTTDQTT